MATSSKNLTNLIHKWDEEASHELAAELEYITLLAYYCNEGYPWSPSADVRKLVCTSLTKSQDKLNHNVAAISILEQRVKPVFSRSSHPGVSAAGRKAETPLKGKRFDSKQDTPAWRAHQEVIALLEYAVQSIDAKAIESQWPLIVPAVLNVVDDYEPAIKAKGCDILRTLITAVSEKFLTQTGLVSVLWDSCRPILSYVPPGTSLRDTLALFPKGVDCMLAIAVKESSSAARQTRLNELLRDGLLKAISHGDQKVDLLIVLLAKLEDTVATMGTNAIAHLQSIVQVYTTLMRDPFLDASPALALRTCFMIKVAMTYCWPRISYYRYDIILGSAFAWRRFQELENVESAQAVLTAISSVLDMLKSVVGDAVYDEDKIKTLEHKPDLKPMFA